MKSIKPGRGPSMMGGVISIIIGLFGVFWTVMVLSACGGFMAIFGILFIIIAIVQAVYNFKNATGKNRLSSFDITDSNEEPDPLNIRFGGQNGFVSSESGSAPSASANSFCPYCGAAVSKDHHYCSSCGKQLKHE